MKHVIQNLKVIFKVVFYLCNVVVEIILMKKYYLLVKHHPRSVVVRGSSPI